LDNRFSIRRVPLDAIHPDPANARLHPERNVEAIKNSLRRFGQAEPLVVQRSTQRLIAGHGRVEAMRALDWTEADIVEVDADDATATALAIALS
jgi:ParB-like chromosome segregation protein Spo0J